MTTQFTPLLSLAGGLLIGLSAVLLMAGHGRIAGMTGIVTGALRPTDRHDWSWRAAFLAGAATTPLIYLFANGTWPEIQVPVSTPMLIIGGLIVGMGVTFGGGCTSGHGVCGLARLSPRSLAATAAFMATTGATVFVVRHVIGG